jgi:hypothetical protein
MAVRDQIEIDEVGQSLFQKSKHDKGARQEESGGPLILESGRPVGSRGKEAGQISSVVRTLANQQALMVGSGDSSFSEHSADESAHHDHEILSNTCSCLQLPGL